ncbi:cation:proton antiporter family protein [Bacillus fonticola]|uniref:cation:proton antiporter family protein n=1 Tax=Bacillus fonticola TaxID=2728853 RepID=UPI00147334E1|nr:cation:proton antiporter family protein [Bacillus fonticola]
MENGESMSSLMIVVAIAFFLPLLLKRFQLGFIPVVVAEIIAGIVIGPSGFNVIREDNWLEILSTLGLIFLMFLSGVEIDFSTMRQKRKKSSIEKSSTNKGTPTVSVNPLVLSVVIFAGMLALSYGLSLLMMQFGLVDDPFFMTIILATVSLGVVVPVLKEREIIDSPLGQTVLLVAVVSDFTTMLLFAYFLAYQSGNTATVFWILLLFVAAYFLYFVLRRFNEGSFYESLRRGTTQIGTRGVFALIIFLVALSETLGAENILGAFLAGVLVSLLQPPKDFVHQLDSFGYGFLIPIFFVMVGVDLNLFSLFEDMTVLAVIPVVFVALYIVRTLPVLLIRKWFPWRETISSGFILTSTMSLAVVAASVSYELGIISEALNGAIILVSVATCLVSPILFNKFAPEKKVIRESIGIVGANRYTIPLSLDLQKKGVPVVLYSKKQEKLIPEVHTVHGFPLIEVPEITAEALEKAGAHSHTKMILATNDDTVNEELAKQFSDLPVQHRIVRLEDPLVKERLKEDHTTFSVTDASTTLLKALILSPSILGFITKEQDNLKEISVQNYRYEGVPLRQLPFLGDVLVLHVYRRGKGITPHGDTVLQMEDRIIVSGSETCIQKMQEELS